MKCESGGLWTLETLPPPPAAHLVIHVELRGALPSAHNLDPCGKTTLGRTRGDLTSTVRRSLSCQTTRQLW